MAKLKESRKKATPPPSDPTSPSTMHSELFSDVARLTSLDIRKTLAKEAKQLRLSREAQQVSTVPLPRATPGGSYARTPSPSPSPSVLVGPDETKPETTKAERRARREKRREDRARSRLEVAWREEMAEREAIAPPTSVEIEVEVEVGSLAPLEDEDGGAMGGE
jgi:hypothetical protein